MAGLFQTLNVGSESLFNSRQGVDTTGHNISNAHTEGYSRQEVMLKARDPSLRRAHLVGNGAFVDQVRRHHDEFLESQLNLTQQKAAKNSAIHDGLDAIGDIYSPEMGGGVDNEITNFFNSLQDVSNFPDQLTSRTALRESAKNLVSSIRRVDASLRSFRSNYNENISREFDEVGEATKLIADLNIKIREYEAVDTKANDLRDQRDLLIRDLSQVMDVDYYEDEHGMITVRGPKDILLVDGSRSVEFEVKRNLDNDGMFDVFVKSGEGGLVRNVTKAFDSGKIAGLFVLRDEVVPALIDKNNELAWRLTARVNSVHSEGFGVGRYEETSGRKFFAHLEDFRFSAQDFDLDAEIVKSVDAMGFASTPNSQADNVIANRLVRVKDERLFDEGRSTFHQFYGSYVGVLGTETLRMGQLVEADQVLVSDLQSRRESVAGVSLDDEAANLLKWQTAFTASSKVITTVDEMLDTVLSLKR